MCTWHRLAAREVEFVDAFCRLSRGVVCELHLRGSLLLLLPGLHVPIKCLLTLGIHFLVVFFWQNELVYCLRIVKSIFVLLVFRQFD